MSEAIDDGKDSQHAFREFGGVLVGPVHADEVEEANEDILQHNADVSFPKALLQMAFLQDGRARASNARGWRGL